MKTDQGVRNFTQDESVKLSGEDPDYATRDLYTSIEKGNYPSWTVYAQVIDPLEAEIYKTNIFDPTRTVSQKDYPLIPFGTITLNQNPVNYFSEVEQAAFAPANIVPGWDVTFDPSKSSDTRTIIYKLTTQFSKSVYLPMERLRGTDLE
jgi:catalase